MSQNIRHIIPLLIFTLWICLANPALAEAGREYTIPEIVDLARANSFLIQTSEENRLASKMGVKSTRADFLPKATAAYRATTLKENPYFKADLKQLDYLLDGMSNPLINSVNLPMADKTMIHWNVSLIQPLFTGFALTSKHRMAKLDAAIKTEEKRQTTLDVAKTAKIACYNVLLAEKMRRVADEAVKTYQAHVEDAEKYYKQALIPYNDLLKFQVALADAIQSREKAHAAVSIAKTRVVLLLNREINQGIQIRDIDPPAPREDLCLEEHIAAAMNQRPILKIINFGLESLKEAETLTKSAYYPTIAMAGRYEQAGDNLAATHNEFFNQHNASLTLEATWTFFEWGKTRADSARVNHTQKALAGQLAEIKNNVRLEIKNNYLNLQVSGKNIRTAEEAVRQARENLRITNLQYQHQVVSSTEVLDARTFLTRADTNYFRAVYGHMINRAELDRSIGLSRTFHGKTEKKTE